MAFNLQLDLFTAVQKFIEARKINDWVKLGIQLISSYWLSLSTITGGALMAHRPPWEALGVGLFTAPIYPVIIWRRSPLTRGMMLALPAIEAKTELETNTQVITK